MKKLLIISAIIIVLIIGAFATFLLLHGGLPVISVDQNNLPLFIKSHYIKLENVGSISKFRSNNGHDFSDPTSPCSSMKHYFSFPEATALRISGPADIPAAPTSANGIPIYSPVDGTIITVESEQFPLGKQIHIRVNSNPEFVVRLFHIYPLETINEGQTITAGTQIGLISNGQGSDIAVEANSLRGRKYYSIFEVMTDNLFKDYTARGATSRDEFILSEEYRKQNPLKCNGEQFVTTGNNGQQDQLKEWVFLN
jgi:hypothetical protein